MAGKKDKIHVLKNINGALSWSLNVMRPYRARVLLYIGIIICQRIFELYMTTRIGGIVDLALSDDSSQLISSGLTLAAFYLSNLVIGLVIGRFASYNYNGMYNHMELLTYRKIMDASWSELTDYHSGDLMTRLSHDIKSIAQNTNDLIPAIVSNLVLIAGAGVYMVILDYTMILVALILAPIVLIASRIFMGKVFVAQRKIKETESKISSYNKETFNNIQAVKAFGLGDYFYARMDELEKLRRKADLRSIKYSLASWGVSFFAALLAAFVCIGWMFYRVHSGVISFGNLSVMAFLAMQVGAKMKELLRMIPAVMEYTAATERVEKLLELHNEEEKAIPEGYDELVKTVNASGADVFVEDMYFQYKNGYSVFEGVSLEAHPGEIVALVGPSGEGKTTMLRLILGIVTAKQGRIYAKSGNHTVDFGKQTRPMISYVPQGNTMMAGSIMENMKMIKPDATEEEINEALNTACIYDFIKQLPDGLNHVLGENALGFSEGQNQRLSIARALLKDAPVFLMDEATSALDVTTERKVLNNIIKNDPHKTVILTTHRPTVLSMCNRVYHISKKKISILSKEDIDKLMDEF